MSMISAQIDELRQMADGQATYRDARVAMLQAADTIWELRDDLQRANAENAKLREQSERLFDKTLELATENSKLRLLTRAAWRCIHTGASCSDCRLIAGGCTLQTAMRELGIEVDG